MKKNLMFSVPMLVVAVLLFMLRTTGIKVHIAVSVVGIALLIAYTLVTKKEWKNSVLEILQRLFYAIAVVTGILVMNVHGIELISSVHKLSAVLFVVLLIGTEIHKAMKK